MITVCYHSRDANMAALIGRKLQRVRLVDESASFHDDGGPVLLVLSADAFTPFADVCDRAYAEGRLTIIAWRPLYLANMWGTRNDVDRTALHGSCVVAGPGGKFLIHCPDAIHDAVASFARRLGQ